MRILSGPVGLAAATLLSCISSVTASPEPNFEISKTSVEIDRHRERLDNGEIVIRVQRTQDLFADATDNADARLLMERDTHLLLHLQLDADKGKINVNDASLDLTPGKLGEVAIAGIKATSYRIPNGEGKTVMSVQEVNSLMEQMSTGIVGVEVKLESEPITPSVPVAHFKDAETQPEIGAMTIRRVGLWIRITEVEGKSIPHTTAIFTPILQLIVTDSGNRVEKIQTLAIDGKAPLEKEALAAMPGPAMVKGGLPDVKPMPPHARPQPPQLHDGHRGHGHHEQPSGLLGWLSRTLDLSRWSPDRAQKGAGQPPRRPCHMRKPVPASVPGAAPAEPVNTHTGEGKVVGHRPMLDNPFSGLADDDEGYASGSEKDMDKLNAHVRPHHEGPHSHSHPHPHHGYHHQHHHHKSTKCGRFFRRMAIGFVYGLAMFGAFLMHPTTLFAVSGLALGGLLFAGVRAMVKKRRAGQLRLGEDGDLGNEAEEPLLGMSEKEKEVLSLQEVIIEGESLPVYEPRS